MLYKSLNGALGPPRGSHHVTAVGGALPPGSRHVIEVGGAIPQGSHHVTAIGGAFPQGSPHVTAVGGALPQHSAGREPRGAGAQGVTRSALCSGTAGRAEHAADGCFYNTQQLHKTRSSTGRMVCLQSFTV